MLFDRTPRFKSRFARKLFRGTVGEKPLSFQQKVKFQKYMEKQLGGRTNISSREYRMAEKRAFRRFGFNRAPGGESAGSTAVGRPEMLRDKIAREKMPPTIKEAAFHVPGQKTPADQAENSALQARRTISHAMPEELRNLTEHNQPKVLFKPTEESAPSSPPETDKTGKQG